MSSIHCAIGRSRPTFSIHAALCLLFFTFSPAVFAVPANPNPFQEVQPDGTVITLRVRGDEDFNWTEDLNGFTVVRSRGWHEYARVGSRGRLETTGLKVGLDNPADFGLARGILPTAAQRAASAKSVSADSNASAATRSEPLGIVKNLVVLIRFSNHLDRTLPSPSDIEVLFNAAGGHPDLAPTGSIRDVYLMNSYGQLQLNSEIADWITVSGTEQYYANGVSGDSTLWEALREALSILDAGINFSQYDSNHDGYIDSIAFLHSGYGAEWGRTDAYGANPADRIWSHYWSIQNPSWTSNDGVTVSDYHISPALWSTGGATIGRIGVIAHETGHFFGLPDLYDTDGGGAGIGSFGLMANSWGFDGTQRCPPHFSPWSKIQLGWIDPLEISGPGQYSIAQSEDSDEYFKISTGYVSNEYLLIENRQQAGFDCSLPQGGLAVWHIDDEAGFDTEGYPTKQWPRNGKHYRVALAQADGRFNLEANHNRGDAGDLHHAGGVDAMAPGPGGHPNTDGYQGGQITYTGHILSNISASGPVMTFCLNGCGDGGGGDPPDPTDGFGAPTSLSATVSMSGNGKNASKVVQLTWDDNSNGVDNEDLFVIERCEESGKGRTKSCDFAQHATVNQDINSFSESPGSSTYIYRVKARKSAGDETRYSNEVKI